MNREQFDIWWKSKGHTPSDTDFAAYQLGQKTSTQTLQGTVESQQNKIAEQIRKAGAPKGNRVKKTPIADHHPTQHYQSWLSYSGTLGSMGYAVTQADYESWLRSQGIHTQSDHDISRQTINSGDKGTGSIAKKEPDHVHDQKQGASTAKGIPKAPPTPPPAPADSPPIATKRTEPYTYPYKNLPFDPSRQPEEIGDPFYSKKYQEILLKWSKENFDRFEKKQPLLPKPKDTAPVTQAKLAPLSDTTQSGSVPQSEDDVYRDLLKKSVLKPATDIQTSPYSKQKPYYLFIDGVKQSKIYNKQGGFYDETGPKLTNLGSLGENYDAAADNPDKIREQAWSRGFNLAGVAASWASAAAAYSKAAAAVAVRAAAKRQLARNAARIRNLTGSGRAGNLSTRVTGTSRAAGARAPEVSRGGLVNRGVASVGHANPPPTRIGELPMGGGARSALTGGGAEALQNAGL